MGHSRFLHGLLVRGHAGTDEAQAGERDDEREGAKQLDVNGLPRGEAALLQLAAQFQPRLVAQLVR